MGSLTQKSSKSVQYFKNYVKICKFKAKLGAPEYTVVVSSFDQAKHRNQNQVFEDSGAETPRFPERPTPHCSDRAIALQFMVWCNEECHRVLTLQIVLRWIFQSLISSSMTQTKTLAAKKFWMKIFAHSIRPRVEPFPHNKHPLEHGSAFLVANSCAIGQLQWVYGLAILSLLYMEGFKPK